jgi:putative hemolysin
MAFSAIFSGMETAVISTNPIRLRHLIRKKVRGVAQMGYLLHNPEHFLGTVLIGNNLCNVIASVTAASLAVELLGQAGTWVSSILMTITLLICCEYLPKAWFQSNPSPRGRHFAPLLVLLSRILYPAVRLLMLICRILFPVAKKTTTNHIITKEDLAHLTLETERTGALSISEREMIQGVFDLDRKTCAAIMTPRSQMITVSADTPRRELLELARECRHNRYPVYRDSPDNIVGIINVFDVAIDRLAEEAPITRYMRPPQFVPATTPTDNLLPRMRLTRQPMALVLDNNSALIGLVTIEDVVEEIIGDAPAE